MGFVFRFGILRIRLNLDFNKIFKISRINLENPANHLKINVQMKKGYPAHQKCAGYPFTPDTTRLNENS